MQFSPSSIPEILIIEPKVHGDDRGFFMEVYESRKFSVAGIAKPFVQDNHSGSQAGTLRGLHYQIHQAQGKLVRVTVGEIFDVAVDMRRGSSTFGHWTGLRMSAENKKQLWIPEGFAHGFYVLSAWAEVVYKTTDFYAPTWERTLVWNDPEVGIVWPLPPDRVPILSDKDSKGSPLALAECFD